MEKIIKAIDLKNYIKSYPDFPKSWINFKDISPLLLDKYALNYAISELSRSCLDSDVIVWLDARWFIFWSLVAQRLWKPFVMIRKAWKLPWKTKSISYWLEYWKDTIEIQEWIIKIWQKISIIDDLLTTWWTVNAAISLIEEVWWLINNISFVISLDEEFLKSFPTRKSLENYKIYSLLNYDN